MTTDITDSDRLSLQSIASPDLTSSQPQNLHIEVNQTVDQTKFKLSENALAVIDVTPRCIRIGAIDASFSSQLEILNQKLKQQSWVKEIAVNQNENNLILTFDIDKMSLSGVLIFLQLWGINPAMKEAKIGKENHPSAQWQSKEFWQNQLIALIPMLAGLAVTGGLRIRGLAAIPVYIIAADITQWLLSSSVKNPTGDPKANKTSIPSQQESNLIDIPAKIPTKLAYKIVHQIPGRIRLYVPLIAQDNTYAQQLERLLTEHPQVTNVRINIQAASVAIAYTNLHNSPADWLQLMESIL
ncbi:MAG TPA: hypothetical protein VK203_25565 [Nostocaceae cyanobacterium]|nr:hypothetical protein [Nostocaceae cyanobacterium]